MPEEKDIQVLYTIATELKESGRTEEARSLIKCYMDLSTEAARQRRERAVVTFPR